jgi:hypothetical protein
MSKKIFNPKDWASPNITANTAAKPPVCTNPKTDIETVTARIEAAVVDIAPNYADWRDLGFALADALGESGRTYYHRLSRFYSGYAENETNKQYDNCLKAHGHGVTIKTLYHLAKSAGIEIAILPIIQNGNLAKVAKPKATTPQKAPEKTQTSEEQEKELTPTFSEIIYNNLPDFLQQVTAKATSPEDKDLLLLGSLVVVSACLPNVFGNYDERRIYPNLFLFLTASASAGKGRLTLCRKLVYPIHKALRERYKVLYDTYK